VRIIVAESTDQRNHQAVATTAAAGPYTTFQMDLA
jgi:hypothetical protein